MPADSSKAPEKHTGSFARDFLASIVVFLVALPLCMGIAVASGAPVASGLFTGMIGGLVVAPIAGSPLQVSGPAAGLTVPVYEVVHEHGIAALGLVVLLAGVLQFVAGLCRLGQWFRAVSPAVIHGMLAGIGVLIFASQFHVMVDDKPRHGGLQNLLSIPEAVAKGLPLPEWTSPEERQLKRELLQAFGTRHQEQVDLAKNVDEVVSIQGSDKEHKQQADLLPPLAQEQERLNTKLKELAQRVEASGLADDDKSSWQSDLQSALATSEAAAADLQARRVEQVNASQTAAADALAVVRDGLKNHNWAAKIGILTIAIIVGWQLLMPKKLRIIPGPLVAIIIVTTLATVLQLPVLYVELPENLGNSVHLPTMSTLNDLPLRALLQMSIMIAIIASAETLLCATAVDQMHNGPRTRYDRELTAQGVGNMLCGLVGALPMTGVIVRSATNVHAGATTRWSAALHGVWLVLFVAFLGTSLRLIPISALAGILVYTGYKLISPKHLIHLWKVGKMEAVIFLIVVGTIVFEDLLIGVLVGIVLSAVKLLWVFSRIDVRLDVARDKRRADLALGGAATFLRLPRLAATLEQVPPGTHLHVDMQRLDYIDHACLDLLMNWAKQHEASGGRLYIDWDSLHARFSRAGMAAAANGNSNGEVTVAATKKEETATV